MTEGAQVILRSVIYVAKKSAGESTRGVLAEFVGEIISAGDVETCLKLLTEGGADLVIVDESIPSQEVLSFLDTSRRCAVDVPIVVVAKDPSVESAVKFIRAGALDYVAAPLERAGISVLLGGMTAERSRTSGRKDRFFCSACPPDVEIVGRSEGMVKALETIRLVAVSKCNPVLILGETGAGKELAARAVHSWRCGPNEQFVAINCAALTASLLESELFGHVKGAFTGADADKTGLFELAGNGTILLDEISEMPPDLQAKLLRVLQERSFRKVGGTQGIRCEATIIASSNRDLPTDVTEGKFRRDLYYRLAVFPIRLPPLRGRDRRDDIELLSEYFIEDATIASEGKAKRLSKTARRFLLGHDWPGNVRELRNVIERALILSQSELITPEHLVIDLVAADTPPPSTRSGVKVTCGGEFSLEAAEREFILRALQETGWQRTRAAALLGITRATLHAKLNRYGITPPGTTRSEEASESTASIQESSGR
jgi:DNA-binding NtrC family response regulator